MKNRWLNYLILIFLGLAGLTVRIDVYPPIWFDEGYKLNAAYTLATEGVFGTHTSSGLHPFDPLISSGPADIGAIALSFKLFGAGIAQARLVIVLYALLALASLYRIAEYLYGPSLALFACLLVLAAPPIQGVSFLMLGRQVLGEIPALALILFGLWMWFLSWEKHNIGFAAVSGLAIGLGLLSKNQLAFALLPAMGIIAFVRFLKKPRLFWIMSMPILLALAVQAGWTAVGWILTPDSIRGENYLLLKESIQIHVLTDLYGSNLTIQAIAMVQIMLFGSIAASIRLWFFTPVKDKNQSWAEALLVLIVIFTTIWFAWFSIGWPRYTFFGLVISWLFIGKVSWDTLKFINNKITKLNEGTRNSAVTMGIASLAVVALATNIYPVVQSGGEDPTKATVEYIQENIPEQELIETWEWELGPLSGHMKIHHPHQNYIFEAIRQTFHERKPFQLIYDPLQADPQYLITGPFSDWTRIYDTSLISEYFEEIAVIGPYRIYQRISNSLSR